MTSPISKTSTDTINALTNFSRSDTKKKVYLKIEYTNNGEPYLRTIDRFGLVDLLQWYFTTRFDLDKVVEVCRGVLTDSNLWAKEENLNTLSKVLRNLNKNILKHNKNHKNPITRITSPQVQGISNAGNTCYINSTIQALRACGSFKEILPNHQELNKAFNAVFTEIEFGSNPLNGKSNEMTSLRNSFVSVDFKEAFSRSEEDPNSLLLPILNSLNFRAVPNENPFPYPHLSLSSEELGPNRNLSISTLLNTHKTTLKSPSEDFLPVFISRHDLRGNKVFKQVTPDRLITIGNDQFSLKAVIIHHGSGQSTGHYTAAVPIPDSQAWIQYNDSRVSQVGEDLNALICENATLFFYEKVK